MRIQVAQGGSPAPMAGGRAEPLRGMGPSAQGASSPPGQRVEGARRSGTSLFIAREQMGTEQSRRALGPLRWLCFPAALQGLPLRAGSSPHCAGSRSQSK